LTALHQDVTVEQAINNTGWPLKVASNLKTTEPPTDEELRLLREELDPQGMYLK
jgi:glutaconate CoA-transferase subunit B